MFNPGFATYDETMTASGSNNREDGENTARFSPRPTPPRPWAGVGDSLRTASANRKSGSNRPNPTGKRLPGWLPWVLGLLLIGAIALPRLIESPQTDTFSYAEFLRQAESGQVQEAIFTNGTGKISGTLTNEKPFSVSGPVTLSAEDRRSLQSVDVQFADPASNALIEAIGSVLPIVLIIGAIIFLSKRNGGAGAMMSVRQSKAKVWTATKPTTTFADIAGYEGVKLEVQEVISFLQHPEKYAEMGAKMPRGILLVGPPGTGKTLMARAVAGEAGVPFISVAGSDFMEMFVGVGASRVRDLFNTAKANAPCIMFIDEIDSIGRKRGAGVGGGHDEREQTLNQMLSEMDGFDSSSEIVVMAATNRPDVLDAALLRPGRFDRQIVVPLPDLSERLPILKVHASHRNLSGDVDLAEIARGTPGMSGADLANLVNEAALAAVRRNGDSIQERDFESARDRVVLGQSRESLVLSSRDRAITAYHEAGHALLATLLEHADPVHKVTIVPHGMALGVTMQLPADDRFSLTKQEALDRLCVMMGGRAAELLVYGHLTTGASNDLVQATQLAHRMVREWGMSDVVGPMAWGSGEHVFLGENLVQSRDQSDATARIIDTETEAILRSAEARAKEMIAKNRSKLQALSAALIERETLLADEVTRICRR